MSARRSDAWIFVSHSVKDVAAVRNIRNALEERGANPILFFLKQEIPDAQLRTFLETEIKARSIFVLCDSENAQASEYVKFEVACAKQLKHVTRTTIDLSSPWHQQLALIDELLPQATIFVSYAQADRGLIRPYIDFLTGRDFALFDPVSDIRLGEAWQSVIQRAIAEAVSGGTLIQFLSKQALQSAYVAAEFNFFVSAANSAQDGRTPILVALEPLPSLQLPPAMQPYTIIDATRQSFDDTCQELNRTLRP